MNAIYSLVIVAALYLLVLVSAGMQPFSAFFGIVIPYAAAAAFLGGVIYKVVKWSMSAVPFRIPTTSGQQYSLPWIKSSFLDNPHNLVGVIGRMALEVLLFRSLFKNNQSGLEQGPRLTYSESKWLWAGALVFHWSFLIIVIRHFRFFMEPVPGCLPLLEGLDGIFEVGVPVMFLTDLGIVAGATFLFLRRLALPQLRYASLPADFFPLFLILGIAVTGVLMRYFTKVDLIAVKHLMLGLTSFSPEASAGIATIFYIHLFFVCVLIAYLPFSKLMHAGGVFLSPTRNLANNNRMKRHVNPWDSPVKVHTYEEYEDEFRDVMKAAGMPLEKEPASKEK